jgi:hypothetical protein
MPTFHITGQANRDLSNDEVAALPEGWTRNADQHNYVQAYDIDAEHIGYALGYFYEQIIKASRGEPALKPVATSVREAPA